MKARNIVHTAFAWVVSSIVAMGTPDREVIVEDRLLGSNSGGFVILRTESDNLGSYYQSRTRRFLVECSKEPKDPAIEENLGAEVKSQLLLEVSTSIDADQSASDTEEPEEERTVTMNEDVKLAELLLRFPEEPTKWDDGKFGKLTWDCTGGLRLGVLPIVWGGWIKERFGVDRNSDLKWDLVEVFEDSNCLFLKVRSEFHGQRWVSIPPRKTRQVRDHLAKQPVYIVAGRFKTMEEAVNRGRELMDRTQGKFKPEIWSVGQSNQKTLYVVVDSQSEEHIQADAFEKLEAQTGIDLTVMSSQRFYERTAVAPSK